MSGLLEATKLAIGFCKSETCGLPHVILEDEHGAFAQFVMDREDARAFCEAYLEFFDTEEEEEPCH